MRNTIHTTHPLSQDTRPTRTMDGNQAAIFDELNQAMKEALEELSRFNIAMAVQEGGDDEEGTESL